MRLFITQFLVIASFTQLLACKKLEIKTAENSAGHMGSAQQLSADQERYIVFFLTNTTVYQADSENTGRDANTAFTFVGELPHLFGTINAESTYKYAFGLPGPMLLTQSVQEMQDQVNAAFDIAEKYGVPVYFQLDDINNYTDQFGAGATPKFYNNPAWCEWVSFPGPGEAWGGQANGRLPYYWFNWGAWMHAQAFPNLASPDFRAFVKNQLENGVLSVVNTRYNALKAQDKGYLFAGMAIGWETHIPDYSPDNTMYNVNPASLPVNVLAGDQMQNWEAGKLGYAALHTLGHNTYDKEKLYEVIHSYSEFLAKTAFDTGIPKDKIFTHIVGIKSSQPNLSTTFAPPIWTAVNDYSTPGFTLSPVSCPYNLSTLVSEIQLADPTKTRFGNVEGYSIGADASFEQADDYFGDMFAHGASIVAVYGWGREPETSAFAVSHSPSSPFVQAAQKWLSGEAKVWSFKSDTEGWEPGQDINGFGRGNDGKMTGTLTGNDAFILSPDQLMYNTAEGGKLQVGLVNRSANKIGQVYFTTTASPDWSEDKRVDFTISSHSSLTNYEIDLSSLSTWQGILKQIRIDVANALPGSNTTGSFSVDYIQLPNQAWDFPSDLQGWTVGQHISQLGHMYWTGDYVGGEITGADAYITSEDSLNFALNDCRYVVVRLKNATSHNIGQIYFTTSTDPAWNNSKHLSFAIQPYSDYTTYTINMSVLSEWTGTLKQLRVDPANALPGTSSGGRFCIEEIKIVN